MSPGLAAGAPTSPVELNGDRAAAAPDGGDDSEVELKAERDAPVGGQAVLEGVMMRGVSNWAVAVRKPTAEQLSEGGRLAGRGGEGEIEVSDLSAEDGACAPPRPASADHAGGGRAGRVVDGRLPCARGLGERADWPPPSEEQETAEEIPRGLWAGTVVVAVVFAIVLFFLIPVGLTSLVKDQLGSSVLFWVVEGLVRTAIFLGYLLLLSRVRGPAPRVRVPRRRAQDDLLL